MCVSKGKTKAKELTFQDVEFSSSWDLVTSAHVPLLASAEPVQSPRRPRRQEELHLRFIKADTEAQSGERRPELELRPEPRL